MEQMAEVPLVGEEFAGYRLVAVLGRGGMSVVFRAENPRLGNTIALKVLDPSLATDDVFRTRFLEESRIAAAMNHPHVIPIHDMGSADGLLYIAMRCVAGTDLRQMIKKRGRMPAETAVFLLGQAARALDAAHRRGLVHRDVKPGNLLVERGNEGADPDHVYLADFGITKHVGGRSGLTSTGAFLGTIDYVAPEQIRGLSVLGPADQYSLGCVLYECLTGRVPFEKDLDAAIIWAHVEEAPTRPTLLRPELPATIDDVFARVLAKNPDDRYRSCRDFVEAARAALGPMAEPPAAGAPAGGPFPAGLPGAGPLPVRVPGAGPLPARPYPAGQPWPAPPGSLSPAAPPAAGRAGYPGEVAHEAGEAYPPAGYPPAGQGAGGGASNPSLASEPRGGDTSTGDTGAGGTGAGDTARRGLGDYGADDRVAGAGEAAAAVGGVLAASALEGSAATGSAVTGSAVTDSAATDSAGADEDDARGERSSGGESHGADASYEETYGRQRAGGEPDDTRGYGAQGFGGPGYDREPYPGPAGGGEAPTASWPVSYQVPPVPPGPPGGAAPGWGGGSGGPGYQPDGRRRRRNWILAALALLLVAGAAAGVTLGLTGGSGPPTAAPSTVVTKPQMGVATGASGSMSASPGGTSMTTGGCPSEQPGDGRGGPTTLAAVLADADKCSVPAGVLPTARCQPQQAPVGEQVVVCATPIPQIGQVTFRTYPTTAALYAAYTSSVTSLAGSFRQNTSASCGNTGATYAEAAWNHQELHPRQYTAAQMAAGKVPQLDAMGRLACFASGKSEDLVWTTGVGQMLAVATGTGSPAAVYDWWAEIHHVIIFPGTEMCGMSGRMDSVPLGNLVQEPVCPAGAGMAAGGMSSASPRASGSMSAMGG